MPRFGEPYYNPIPGGAVKPGTSLNQQAYDQGYADGYNAKAPNAPASWSFDMVSAYNKGWNEGEAKGHADADQDTYYRAGFNAGTGDGTSMHPDPRLTPAQKAAFEKGLQTALAAMPKGTSAAASTALGSTWKMPLLVGGGIAVTGFVIWKLLK